ncbi:hypothetical protein FQZ97_1087670 [compost metagenome]
MGGVISKTSRITAAMKGSTMNARMMPAARMPRPLGAPPNSQPMRGMPIMSSRTGIWKWSANTGANTNRPNMP